MTLLLLLACGEKQIPTDSETDDTAAPDSGGDTLDDTGEDTSPPDPAPRFSGALSSDDADIILATDYDRDATGWEETMATAPDLDGDGADELIVAAKNTSDAYADWFGVVYLTQRPATGTSSLQAGAWLTLKGQDPGGMFGTGVASPGDLDGDGEDDLAISAPGEGDGTVHLFRGPFLSGTLTTADATTQLLGEEAGSYTGVAINPAGDMDQDGIDDLIVGSYAGDGCKGCGTIYVSFAGTETGAVSVGDDAFSVEGGGARGPLDTGAVSGDIDGDGIPDLVVGTPTPGGAGLFYGPFAPGAVEIDDSDAWFADSSSGYAGMALTTLDMDGDGYDELVSGAPYSSAGGNGSGEVIVVPGSATRYSGTTALAGAELIGAPSDYAGMHVESAGDLDRDGNEDLLVSAPWASRDAIYGGVTYLVYGPVSGTANLADIGVEIVGLEEGASTGQAAAAGDYDGDGFDDLALGTYALTGPLQGGAYIFLGG